MDYQKFKQDFISSGLSQSQYGKKIGMSSSMVSYYLGKSKKSSAPLPSASFSSVRIKNISGDTIRIKTSSGIEIEIPI